MACWEIVDDSRYRIRFLKGNLRIMARRGAIDASNIAINGGRQQPVSFVPGEEAVHLMDAHGTGLLLRIAGILGRSAILEYRPVPGSPASLGG